jgi:hypothetical protein
LIIRIIFLTIRFTDIQLSVPSCIIHLDGVNKTDSIVNLGGGGVVTMTEYTFFINGEYKTVEADTEEEALKDAGIEYLTPIPQGVNGSSEGSISFPLNLHLPPKF